jgi:hypothetical protein
LGACHLFGRFNNERFTDFCYRYNAVNKDTSSKGRYRINKKHARQHDNGNEFNNITSAAFMGTVGVDWQVAGFGNFSSLGETDMIMRSANTGGLEVYDISNNQVTGAAFMGTVGTDWQFAGVAPIHGPGTTDLVLRNIHTGQFEVYDIANNQIAGATSFGAVGLNWQVVGFGTLSNGTGSYMMVRNTSFGQTGVFQVYDISNDQITDAHSLGAFVGADWQVGGFVVDLDFRKDNSEAIRKVCARFIVLCRGLGLFGEVSIAVDGSKFKAVNNRDKNFTRAKMERRLARPLTTLAFSELRRDSERCSSWEFPKSLTRRRAIMAATVSPPPVRSKAVIRPSPRCRQIIDAIRRTVLPSPPGP